MEIYWKPHPKQVKALQSECFETLFGGARGGGKTDCGMANCLYDIDNPKLRQLVIRRNFDDLKDWIDRARSFFLPCKPEFTLSNKEITFPSGAKILLGHLKDDGAYTKYQGHEYHRILIEELTHIPSEELYLKLISSCRSTVKGLKPRVFATTNPGEIGHKWVRKRFVDVTEAGETYTDPTTGRTRLFVQSRVEDNPTLMEVDPDYVRFLDGLPDGLREQWREGSWDDVEIKGAYYIQQIKQAQAEHRICKLPYDDTILVNLVFDLGISKTDQMTAWAYQNYGKEKRVLQYWAWTETSLNAMLKSVCMAKYKNNFGTFYFPHDIMVREFSDGRTRKDTVEEFAKIHEFDVEVVPAMNPQERVHMTRLIFPAFWFDAELCEEGLDALRNYRKEYDQKNLVFKENPLHDWASHGCLVAGSKVLSICGERNIEDIIDGEFVWTPAGYSRVLHSGKVKDTKELLRITFADNTVLECTPEHKFFTNNSLTRADSLRIMDVVWKQIDLSKSNSKELFTNFRGDITLHLQAKEENTVTFTGRFGAKLTEIFPRTATSIIKMETVMITVWKTLSVYLRLNTYLNTLKRVSGTSLVRTLRFFSLKQSQHQKHGTHQKKVSNGTVRTERSVGKKENGTLKSVRSAVKSIKHLIKTNPSFATTVVKIETLGDGKTQTPVYDLTVENHHCYLANGVLVSNSDSFGIIGVTHKDEIPVSVKAIPFENLGARQPEENFANPFGL